MNILFVAAEVTPVIKVGGLGDVVGALPKALRELGHDARVIIPYYTSLRKQLRPKNWFAVSGQWAGKRVAARVGQAQLPDSTVPLWLVDVPDQPELFSEVYATQRTQAELAKELRRFITFSSVAAGVAVRSAWRADVVHAHDWHSASTILWLGMSRQRLLPRTVLTIHNLNTQGKWQAKQLWSWFGPSAQWLKTFQLRDYDRDVNLFQQGIVLADSVNTVSPTYAKEILTSEFGFGLERDLARRPQGVQGVLNGIDIERFNPASDPDLSRHYTAATVAVAKPQLKAKLQTELGLPVNPKIPLVVSVGRLTPQKGYQLLAAAGKKIFSQPLQLAILGSGNPDIARALQRLQRQFSTRMAFVEKFNAALANRMYAGGDAFLMPSQFEPCGLGQMIAMRYGTLPIVRDTGGLHDTVVDLADWPEHGTGFVFQPFTSTAIAQVIKRALRLFAQSAIWSEAVQRAMAQDFSWDRSARAYLRFYGKK